MSVDVRSSEARLAEAQSIGRVGDFEIWPDGSVTSSAEVFRILGLSESNGVRSFEQLVALIHPDDRARATATYHALQADAVEDSDGPLRLLFRITRPADGQHRMLSVVILYKRDGDGRFARLHGTVQDVTELEHALASAHERGSRFEALFSRTLDGVYFAELDQPIRWDATVDKDAALDYVFHHLRMAVVNDLFCEQTGIPREQYVGRTPSDILLDPLSEWQGRTRDVLDRGHRLERIVITPPGRKPRVIEGQTVCLFDASGAITGLFGIGRDVTEREEVAEQARQDRERLALALDAGELFVWDLDLTSGAVRTDPRWLEALGYAPSDVGPTADWWNEQVHVDDRPVVADAFERARNGSIEVLSFDVRVRTHGGEWRWVHSRGKVLERDEQGRPRRLVGMQLDLTERKQLEQRVRLVERLASVGTLVAGTAHELNNPLSFVTNNLEHITRELATLEANLDVGIPIDRGGLASMRAAVADAASGAERIGKIVRSLKTFSRSDDEPLQRVDLRRVLELSIQLSAAQIYHRARLVCELAPVPVIIGNEGRLSQVFVNLLVNAAQAIPDGAADQHTIRVATGLHSDGRAMVEITDTGCGIEPGALGRIFDPFFTTKPVGEGMGLGLALSHAIVTEIGGEIEVESTLGKGTRFRVLLPVAAAAVETPSVVVAPAPPTIRRLRLLVIDDEPLLGQTLRRLLSNHDVTVESRGAAALARIAAGERFDRILCDLMMPELSGMDIHQVLGRDAPDQQRVMIFMTGGAFSAQARAFLRGIPNAVLDKPFDLGALEAALGLDP